MLNTDFNEILNSQLFKTVAETSVDLGIEIYVVGGFVRDHLLNRKRENTDVDFVVIGSGIVFAKEIQKNYRTHLKYRFLKPMGLQCSNGKVLV